MELEIITLSETSYFYKDQHGKLSFLCGFGSWSRRSGLMGCGGGKEKGVLEKMMGWWIWSQDMKDICEAATISALNTRASILKGMSCKCFLWTWSACFCQPHCPREKFSFHLCPHVPFYLVKDSCKICCHGGNPGFSGRGLSSDLDLSEFCSLFSSDISYALMLQSV